MSNKKHAGGRPTKIDEITLKKLEEAFAMGCTDKEACLYANISTTTLYNYQEKVPEFLGRKEELKENPVLKAKSTVFDSLDKVQTAQWYLERRSNEFKPKADLTTNDKDIGEQSATLKVITEQLNALHRGTGITSDGGTSGSVGTETPDKK